jgi:hypothetical protein
MESHRLARTEASPKHRVGEANPRLQDWYPMESWRGGHFVSRRSVVGRPRCPRRHCDGGRDSPCIHQCRQASGSKRGFAYSDKGKLGDQRDAGTNA